MPVTNEKLLDRLLEVMEDDIVPLTREGVAQGNKVFGSAILRKDDLALVVAGTNNENQNPLWHGEVHTLKLFYELPAADRPATADCIFLATHEPCSLCLSAITWTGFDNFHYLFAYQDTAESFNIPHDLKILQEVFAIKNGAYVRQNAFWTSHSIVAAIAGLSKRKQVALTERVNRLTNTYATLSETYQCSKGSADIPLP